MKRSLRAAKGVENGAHDVGDHDEEDNSEKLSLRELHRAVPATLQRRQELLLCWVFVVDFNPYSFRKPKDKLEKNNIALPSNVL